MNIKLNKLAENRLNEKEMRDLIGGYTDYELRYCISAQDAAVCSAVCSCTYHPPLLNPVSSNGETSACDAQKPLA